MTFKRRIMTIAADVLYSAIPRPNPGYEALVNARIVAHRGRTGRSDAPMENTLAAFDQCHRLGAFGIEFDLQWTRDGVPVVFHDDETTRLFEDTPLYIGDTPFEVLRERLPTIPALFEVIRCYGGTMHLMIELKPETLRRHHIEMLNTELDGLTPGKDYHLLSLEPDLFDLLPKTYHEGLIAVAETNTSEIMEAVRRRSLKGFSGHYVLLDRKLRRELDARGIAYGVGMVPGENVLRRELGLGSHWVFTDHTERLQKALTRALEVQSRK